MKYLYLVGAFMIGSLSASVLQAGTISLSIQENNLAALTASNNSGFVHIADNTTYNDFTIESLTGTGSPELSVPYLDLSTFDVSTSLSTSATLTIMLTETNLSQPGTIGVNSFFTGILNGVTSETLSSYYDPSNTAYGMGDLLGTTTFTAAGSNSINEESGITTSGKFSETEVIVATFAPTSGNPDSLNSSALITATPEPMSMAFAGAGLFGIGLIGARRRKKA